ncbi:MAG: ABC transporter permease subunit [Bacteroidota bacterium]
MFGILLLTLRELTAKKITLGLFLMSTLIWVLLSFALNLDIVDGTLAGLRIFGQEAQESGNNPLGDTSLLKFVVGAQTAVAGASYWIGILLALFATAPLINNMLERGRIDLLLSKPISRPKLLLSHVLGVLLVVFLLATYLMGMIWLVMSIKSGVWHTQFLSAIVMVMLMFAVMYSIVLLLGVTTQSTALSLIVTYGLIFCSIIFAAKDQLAMQINPPWRQVYLGLYHALPNFAEVTKTVVQLAGGETVETWYPLFSSLLFGAVVYALAFFQFNRKDF